MAKFLLVIRLDVTKFQQRSYSDHTNNCCEIFDFFAEDELDADGGLEMDEERPTSDVTE